jgi:ABC-type bacteriocin/lantibiotic exporter with double-glycine peptidase domain
MKKSETLIVKKPLLSWIFKGNRNLKLLLVMTVFVTVFLRIIPLEMQKRIVNQAIKLKEFELLLIYCGLYLAAVVIAGGLKFVISYLQTIIGQHALADMRKDLYRHVLTLPLGFFRKTQPGMVVQSFVSELATAGDFVGMAVAIPVTSILSLLAFTVYLLWLNPLLAIVSLAIYPVTVFVLPMLQRRANMENKKRVDVSRDFSGKLAEAISGINEIQGNAAYHLENTKFESLVNKLQKIRITWNLYRQAIKVSSNFFTNFSPFIIFLLGGYLTIKGRLELGALVAFLSAQEKLFDPWSELIDVYQAYQEASVSYQRTMQYFDVAPEFAIEPEDRQPYQLDGSIEVKNLSFKTEDGVQLLDDVNFNLPAGSQLALIGFSGSGKSTLANCIGQLYRYANGHVRIGNQEVADLTKRDIAWNMGIVSQTPFIFDGPIEENLLYGCTSKMGAKEIDSASPLPDLDQLIEIIEQIGLFPDVLRFGLNSVLDFKTYPNLLPKLIRVRKKLARRLGVPMSEYVEFFDKEKYQYYSTVAENLTFGSANQDVFRETNLSNNEYFLIFLKEVSLLHPLMVLGTRLCRQAIEILGNLPPTEVFFEQSPFAADELEKYKSLYEQLNKLEWSHLNTDDQKKLLELALGFVPGRHKMIRLPDGLKQDILRARTRFREKISKDFPDAFGFYRKSDYLFSLTILNNLFFGKFKTTNPQIQDAINEQVVQLLIEEDLLETILKIGMQFQVGSKGDRLSGGQRQKLAIGRAFLKNPKVLIMDEATSGLDNRSQARIQSLLDSHWKGKTTLIAVVHRLDIIKGYDNIGVMKSGKIEEMGTYEELIAKKGLLYELVAGKR